jgi:mRNA interferase MazF
VRRGEIRWYTFAAPDKRRPVLLLTRTTVIDTLNEIIVVPATRTVRGIRTEILLSKADGMPETCALNFDHVALAQRTRIGALITELAPSRWPEVEAAMLVACGFRDA